MSQPQSAAAGEATDGNTWSWGWTLAFGVLTVLAGIAALVWTGATVLVIAVIFGAQLLVAGVYWFVRAVTAHEKGIATHILLAILAIVAGVVVLRYPVQTAFAFPLVLGLFWIVNGVVETFEAIVREAVASRGWAIASGVLSIIAGVALLVFPGIGLVTLTWVLGFWLVVYGCIAAIRAVRMRPHAVAATRTPPTAGPAPA